MKLITFKKDNSIHIGVLAGKGIVDLTANFQSVKQIIAGGAEAIKEIGAIVDKCTEFTAEAAVELLAPIPQPGKIIALAGNYVEHIKEAGLALGLSDSPRQTTVPRPFIMPATVVTGTGRQIPWPEYSRQIDYEIELAAIIGKKTKCVSCDEAIDYVAGYTICNDISARSVTFKAGRAKRPWDEFFDWLNGKWADGFLPMGPYILSRDEIEDVQNLEMVLKVNGQVRQEANTSQMIYPVADVVSFLSHIMTLEPGDVIATGTPCGVGMAAGRFLQGGDVIECTIENLGTLTNTLGPRPGKFYEPLG